MEQLNLFADAKHPPTVIRCPDCKHCPAEDSEPIAVYLGIDDRRPVTIDDQLAEFEVVGCLDGHIMCRECGWEFPWPPG